ncbi:hypothetical protein F5888DRAFT_933794 [Russula emetica]|nr:hypothetical protein F5888DRAFT_933794 [Russula emetica]
MYISSKSTRTIRSRRSTKRRAQFRSKVTTLTSRTYRSVYRNLSRLTRSLEKRKGGGGRGRGSSGTKGEGTKGEDSGTKSLGKPSKVKLDGENLPNNKKSATSYGAGGGQAAPISPGLPFAGRTAGGGDRQGVYGDSIYGSGYPGVLAPHGVSGLDFPYYFWPIVWYDIGNGQSAYLFDSAEYGLPDNTSRPGGPQEFALFHSKNTSSTFMVLADKSTVSSLLGTVKTNCSSYLSNDNTSSSLTPYTNQSTPGPQQAIQYYRASTVVLTLDGYDSGVLNGTQNLNASVAPVISLPNGTDTALLTCLNDTIGRAVPLVDAGIRTGPPAVCTLLVAWLLAGAFRSMFGF